ncbi:MAG TPA: diacylglycerol kinase family protein [Marmoricola sp.]|nr:diacylglycerol kinase family protein [Marmoricola sp.]
MSFGPETRQRLLVGAAAAALWVVLASLLVWLQPAFVDRVDHGFGEPFAAYTDRHAWVESTARFVASWTRFVPMTIYTLVVAALLAYRGFRRPALWMLVISLGCAGTTTLMKMLFARERPDYAHMELRDGGFPSGHSSGAAMAAGIAIVLAILFLRRRNQRRLVTVVALGFAFLIGLDRLLLGVHGLTDVLTGWALAAFWVTTAAYLVDPTPRAATADPLPTALPRTRQLAVILNPIKVEDPAAFRGLVNQRAAELGWAEPSWFQTTVADPGRSMAHEAAIEGAELVVVCGGDGTVRTVCAELAGTGIPVGVVPAGTGNLLARNLDLPLYLNAAVDVALNGQDRAIDIVRIAGDGFEDDEHFLVMAGMGFDAAIMEGANEQLKAKVGWLAYVVAGFRSLMFPAVRVDISVDDEPFTRHRVRTIVVGNVGFLQAGLPLLPDAAIDDGRIDVVMVNPARFLSWLRVVGRVVSRGRRVDETVNRMTGRKVVIKAAHSTPRQVDGDPIGAGQELICECLPGKLLVRVPR